MHLVIDPCFLPETKFGIEIKACEGIRYSERNEHNLLGRCISESGLLTLIKSENIPKVNYQKDMHVKLEVSELKGEEGASHEAIEILKRTGTGLIEIYGKVGEDDLVTEISFQKCE